MLGKNKMRTKHFSMHRYIPDVKKDIALGRRFPEYRGTWLPSFDRNYCGHSVAINRLGIRIRIWSKVIGNG